MKLYNSDDSWRFLEIPKRKEGNLPEEDYRSEVRRDYARILHSPAFRRLQGKTQLFPGEESDFFRNRLTHSLEVGQIAYDIAIKLNETSDSLQKHSLIINPEICEIAGLVHDLGHPPFGHNGEKALDDCMKQYGGFEGNAQTLRILLKLEKKERRQKEGSEEYYIFDNRGKDQRVGLNLSSRVLASCLKYDNEINFNRTDNNELQKGYYQSDSEEVETIKQKVMNGAEVPSKFKTVECYIMDVADDIAYSTYDLEDSLKAGFLTPMDFISNNDDIIEEIEKKFKGKYSKDDIKNELYSIFGGVLLPFIEQQKKITTTDDDEYISESIDNFKSPYESSLQLSKDGYLRNNFTSYLVNLFMNGVEIDLNETHPQLSKVFLNDETRFRVEVLKYFTYCSIINSSKLKIAEFRGYDIIKSIYDALSNKGKDGYKLLPEDFQKLYNTIDEREQHRIICDFIAGMTDKYALEFYCRLYSENPQTIFKPL